MTQILLDQIINFLKERPNDAFYKSLLEQYERKNYLSPKQIACVERAIMKEETKNAPAPEIKPLKFSLNEGEIIEIKAWLAKKFKEELNKDFFLRNLEVVQVIDETKNAYQARFKFVSKVVSSCHVCGRNLEDEISKAVGIGPTCAKKIGLSRPTLNEAHKTLVELEALCIKVGVLDPLWVPKSQIKMIHKTGEINESK